MTDLTGKQIVNIGPAATRFQQSGWREKQVVIDEEWSMVDLNK